LPGVYGQKPKFCPTCVHVIRLIMDGDNANILCGHFLCCIML
jgi:hypothetical protein